MTKRDMRLVGRGTRRLAGILAALVAATLAAEAPGGPAAAADWTPPKPKQATGVPRHNAVHTTRPTWTAGAREVKGTPAVTWPAASTTTVSLADSRVRAGALAVSKAPAGRVGKVTVAVRDHAAATKAGVAGLILDVSRADGVRAAGQAEVTVDYSSFAHAYGGDWSSRLRLISLADGHELAGKNNTAASTVTALVPLAADGAAVSVALAAGPSGQDGTYAATSLSQAGTWQVSQQTGAFSWGQDLRMPPSLNGPGPKLSLSYSSLSVDGRTAGTNTQGSWIGDGWDMWPGYIERQYTACQEDKAAVGGAAANNASLNVGDLCWLKPEGNASFSLNGRATELVKSSGNTWKGVSDDGEKIELLKDASFGNGDDDGEYWKVTTTDGTQYSFGRNHGVGGATASTATNSTWTVPVYGNHPNEPGYTAGDFAGSRKTQGWRWNLDYVVDTHGNTMTLFYDKEQGAYGREGDPAKRTTYDRGGYVTSIEYGSRNDAASTVQAAAKVVFDTADRCASNCYTGTPPTPVQASWLDTPWDQYCAAAPCTTQLSPTFWTQKRLAQIRTQVYSGSGTTYTDVDQWALRHTYLQAGGNEGSPMWLAGVTHTGKVTTAGGTASTDPEIVFDPGSDPLANRVDGPADGRSSLFRYRIKAITTESGAQIVPTYSQTECTRSALPSPATNTSRCFPQWYGAPGEEPTLDWFHSYRVQRVDVYDNTGGFTHEQTNYDYLDAPVWHYEDSELVPEKKRTWGNFRGYSKVRVRTGLESGTQSATEYLYFRGMDGDKQTSGVRDVSVTDSQNVSIKDDDAYAGLLREQTTLLGAGGDWISGTITTPGKQGPTATSGPLKAYMTNTAMTRSRTKLSSGATRWVKTVKTYNTDNLVTQVDDLGDEATAADDRCARTSYARNSTTWILSAVKKTETVGVNCSATATLPDDMLSSTRITYDKDTNDWNTFLPVKGDVAKTEQIDSWTGTTPNWVQTGHAVYDANGRATDAYDALGHKTHTAYTPPLTGPVTQSAITDPMNHTVTTTLDRGLAVPTKIVDDNGLVTDMTYDGSGRLLGIWQPGRAKASYPNYPNTSYDYRLHNNAPTTVTTKALLPNGSNTYATTITLYDGQLRQRQTQSQAPGGGRVIADTVYDSRGLVDWSSIPYYDTNNNPPNTALAGGPGDPPAPATTVNVYDGANRNTAAIFKVGTAEKWRTTTAYAGERVDITPPAGGTATAAVTDARGHQIELRQYKSLADAGSTDPAKYDKTTYTYTGRDELATVTDPAGNTWKYTYDQRGRKIKAEDPDTGTTQMSYDNAGRLATTTSGRNITLAYIYDDAGRKTQLRLGSATGTLRAEWIYDGLTRGIGKLNKSIRYEGGQQYINEVTGFDTAGRPTGTKITIPSTEGTLCAAGGTTPCTFADTVTYRANGQIASTGLPAAADLPAETLLHGYNDVGASNGLLSTAQIYVNDVTYDKLGHLTQKIIGAELNRVWLNYTYEDHTGRLVAAKSIPELKPEIFNFAYQYDNAGNLTRIADQPAAGSSDTQCYSYDYLARLTEAWTPGSGDCAAAPTTAALGGAAPYWHSYQYAGPAGLAGSRTKETQHASTGDTVRDYTYPVQGGPAGSKPHAVTQVTTTGAATRTENYQYDAGGNTNCRPSGTASNTCPSAGSQTLTWNEEDKLASVTGGTSYVYDADGNRLIRRDATGTTLYLPDGTELRKTASAVNATRYYAGVATRTAAGVTWIAGDHHGTAEATVNASTLAVSRRRTLPFGNERGATTGTWPTFMDKGFVGGTKEPNGLTHLGARDYDPGLGRFVSADPVQDLNDPQQWNGYAYANNSPGTSSDPSGLMFDKDHNDQRAKPPKTNGGGGGGGGQDEGDDVGTASVESSLTGDEYTCISGYFCFDGRSVTNSTNYIAAYNAELARLKNQYHLTNFRDDQYAEAMLAACGIPPENCNSQLYNQLQNLWGDKAVRAKEAHDGVSQAKVAEASFFAAVTFVAGLPSCVFKAAAAAGRKSFSGDTPVLMADGNHKKFKNVRLGDKVIATDPETGAQGPREVTAIFVHHDDLYTLVIDGKPLTTTEDHPFWNVTDHRWERADQLTIGDRLLSPDGSTARVDGFTFATHHVADAYNLTVDDLHTYYVLAGTVPVLVHNDDGRFGYLNRPGYSNYVLMDANGSVYYSGMFGPGDTATGVQYRHANNGNRFNPANGDTMRVMPGTRTYGESRLMEQRLAEQYGTIIGRDGSNYRGNRQNPLAGDKLAEYEGYERRLGGGCK
ncbi:polymorphic toxin-type HINT domain-containing protein [Actinoplanes sp. KI2]|uniref:polymorphic toxin-type HINT domain-containing protein n=1 Tax=Actinoplanes sp. KI2 TaxID=2983315 RepID=UPI0021D5B4D6|nr:polymorphic toxin-type HINT domain-containing protein [Actinoplanes sp. KI2]MCU7724010.1 polymorphic toxin-type HINT domain-containing protein [Actinoplanes sp. KI2]